MKISELLSGFSWLNSQRQFIRGVLVTFKQALLFNSFYFRSIIGTRVKKWTLFLVLIGIVIVFFISKPAQDFIKRVQLISFYGKLTNYEKNSNHESIYELLSPDYKRTISLKDFLAWRNENKPPYSIDYIPYSYKVDGNKGLIDRTMIVCDTQDCTGVSRHESRAYKEYIYLNGRWYVPEESTVLCTRGEPYGIAPEFERAISLLMQRLGQDKANLFLDENIKSIRNCLNVTYSSEVDKYEAEGLFYFDEKSTKDKLNILVSNKYRANDDILTAGLLIHEITHAYVFASGLDLTCYQNEAEAFYNQILFVTVLNKAEKDSIVARRTVGGSREIDSMFEMISKVNYMKGNPYEGILKIVQSDPYYQKQCENDK